MYRVPTDTNLAEPKRRRMTEREKRAWREVESIIHITLREVVGHRCGDAYLLRLFRFLTGHEAPYPLLEPLGLDADERFVQAMIDLHWPDQERCDALLRLCLQRKLGYSPYCTAWWVDDAEDK